MVAEVGNAAVLGKWISQSVWGVIVEKLEMGSLKRQRRWESIYYYRIVRCKGKKGFMDV